MDFVVGKCLLCGVVKIFIFGINLFILYYSGFIKEELVFYNELVIMFFLDYCLFVFLGVFVYLFMMR